MKTFEIGCTYSVRSICDHNCIWEYTVVSRTEKSVTIKEGNNKAVRRKVMIGGDGNEFIYPEGVFSMCPVLRAGNKVTA